MKKRKVLFLTTAAVLCLFALWRLAEARTSQLFGELVSRVATSDSVVALTFDDSPTPGYTEQVMALLREKGVKATFFATGRETSQHLDRARQIVEEGHELGNHS